MKKFFLAIVLAGSAIAASAQTKATFGIKGGVNFASMNASASGTNETASSGTVTSFSFGVIADAPIGTDGFSIQPGLFYTGKGADSNDGSSTGKIKLNYLQLPVNVVYSIPVSGGSVFFGLGPYAAFALSGKIQDKAYGRNVSVDVNFGDDFDSEFKRTDFGITSMAGFRFKNGLLLNVNYDAGLSNILSSNISTEGKLRNQVAGISIGYSF